MTEQSQQPGQVEEEGQPTGTASGYAPEQEVAPAPEAQWRFFVRVQRRFNIFLTNLLAVRTFETADILLNKAQQPIHKHTQSH